MIFHDNYDFLPNILTLSYFQSILYLFYIMVLSCIMTTCTLFSLHPYHDLDTMEYGFCALCCDVYVFT